MRGPVDGSRHAGVLESEQFGEQLLGEASSFVGERHRGQASMRGTVGRESADGIPGDPDGSTDADAGEGVSRDEFVELRRGVEVVGGLGDGQEASQGSGVDGAMEVSSKGIERGRCAVWAGTLTCSRVAHRWLTTAGGRVASLSPATHQGSPPAVRAAWRLVSGL
jgi:hypothetical protein